MLDLLNQQERLDNFHNKDASAPIAATKPKRVRKKVDYRAVRKARMWRGARKYHTINGVRYIREDLVLHEKGKEPYNEPE